MRARGNKIWEENRAEVNIRRAREGERDPEAWEIGKMGVLVSCTVVENLMCELELIKHCQACINILWGKFEAVEQKQCLTIIVHNN